MKKPICFVIMGYGKKTDLETGKTFDLDKTYINVIKPAAEAAGYQCVRGDEIIESGLIDKSMYTMLVYSDLVIADISTYNPNAIYELGIRHAAKPYSTIIIKEDEGKLPFDLSHSKIFHYKHLGDDIGKTEADRCVQDLKNLIEAVSVSKEVDSPLFEFIKSLSPHDLNEDEYISIIKELTEKGDNVYTLVEHARSEMNNSNFTEARKLWERARKLVPNEQYFVQQHALSVYKSEVPSAISALTEALKIIQNNNPDDTNDPETLGITGAIYKRLWENTSDKETLLNALKYYKKGFSINTDYYTGENYALCLLLLSEIEEKQEEKIYYKIEAKRTCVAIIESLDQIFFEDDYDRRIDLKWIYAGYSNCSLLIDDIENAEKYEANFKEMTKVEWELESFEKTKKLINKIKTA